MRELEVVVAGDADGTVYVSTDDGATWSTAVRTVTRGLELAAGDADLRYRGFSSLERDSLGYERFDYADVSPTGSWSPPAGPYSARTPSATEEREVVRFGP